MLAGCTAGRKKSQSGSGEREAQQVCLESAASLFLVSGPAPCTLLPSLAC